MEQQSCIFCKILEGEIPSFTVYEDEVFKVILDRFPASPGHMLILPKKHFASLFEMPEREAQEVYKVAKKMAEVLKKYLHVEGINIVQNNGAVAGQTIDHFHLHLVPRYKGDQVVLNQTTNMDTTLESLQEIANKIMNI